MKRREFIRRVAQTTAVVSTTALSTSRALGANERVGIGVIGCGLIGRIHTRSFVSLPGAQVVAVADTYQPRLDAAQMVVGGGAKLYRDFRRLLEDKNVDAVVVAIQTGEQYDRNQASFRAGLHRLTKFETGWPGHHDIQ